MDVHQDADVGVPHSIEHLTGHGLGEEGVICRGDKHAFPGALQQHATFSPPDRETLRRLTSYQTLQIIVMFICQQEILKA